MGWYLSIESHARRAKWKHLVATTDTGTVQAHNVPEPCGETGWFMIGIFLLRQTSSVF